MSKKSFRDHMGTVFGPDAEKVGPASRRDKARHRRKSSKGSMPSSPKRGGWR